MTTQIQIGAIATSAVQSIQGPRITSVYVTDSSYNNLDDTAVDSTSGGYIKIIGTGFASGCIVVVGGLTATSTTFVSSTEVRAQIQAQAAGSYTLYLSNSDGSLAIKAIGISFSGLPAWSTSTSQTFNGASISFQFSASSDSTVSYSLDAGSSLPPGLSLSSGGLLSGTFTGTSGTVYTFTLQATDSENQNSPRTFSVTISLSDPYFYLTTFATHADGPTVLTDASTNNFDLTVSGTPRANNNTPFGTGWSVYLNGSNSYLTMPGTPAAFGTGNFTVECWIYPTALLNTIYLFDARDASHGGNWAFGWGLNGNGYDLCWYNGTSIAYAGTSSTWALNTWHHVAYVRNSNTGTIYKNGISVATGADSFNYNITSTTTYLGCRYSAEYFFPGYISNFRFNTTAVYTGAFTPSTTPLAAINGTNLLICQNYRYSDASTNAYTISTAGSPTVQSFNPFNLTNTGTDGSMYFNGSTDYLSIPFNSNFNTGTGDFCVESWFYIITLASPTNLWGCDNGGGSTTKILLYVDSNGTLHFDYTLAGGSSLITSASGTISTNRWTHIAAVRSTGVFTLYVNGVSVGTSSASINMTGLTAPWTIGYIGEAYGSYLTGYISNFRFVKGSPVYTTTFTPPTSALTAVSNTQILILQNKYSHNTSQGHQDTSTNQLLVTSTGTPASGNFSPFSQTGWSNYFGSANYFTAPSNAAYAIGSSTFTFEAWVYPSAAYTTYNYIYCNAATGGFVFYVTGGALIVRTWGSTDLLSSSTIPALNTWSHVVAVRSGTTLSIFVNGVRTATGTVSTTFAQGAGTIGNDSANLAPWLGYISNLRLVVGTAVYDPTQSTLSVPTNPLTAVANTQLLTCQSNRFIDNSTNAFTLTTSGSPSIQSFSPFAPAAVYSPSTNGGSVYFGGTSDWITAPMNTAITGDFTAECWIYCTASAAAYNGIFAKRTSGSTYSPFLLGLSAGGSGTTIALLLSTSGSSWAINTTFSAVTFNQWNHIALVRNGSAINCYLNGTSVYSGTLSGTLYNPTDAFSVGALGANGYGPFNGYISNARLVIGTAVYTSAFTPPTAPVTSTTNTVLLAANGTGTALTDVTSRSNMITTGIAKISTATKKYGTGSMYFNGSTDYFTTNPGPMSVIGSGDFTIEHWVNFTSTTAYINTISDNTYFTTTGNWIFMWNYAATGYLSFWINNAVVCSTSAAYNDGNWHHVAVTRSGTTITIWIDGVSRGTGTSSASIGNTSGIIIGNQSGTSRYFTGYIDDVRITRYARYTSAFTPPTTAFKDQ